MCPCMCLKVFLTARCVYMVESVESARALASPCEPMIYTAVANCMVGSVGLRRPSPTNNVATASMDCSNLTTTFVNVGKREFGTSKK